jgi:hypothetical protein
LNLHDALTLNAPVAPTAPPPVRSRDLAADYPACFDWTNPRPLKRHIYKDLARIDQQAAGPLERSTGNTWSDQILSRPQGSR